MAVVDTKAYLILIARLVLSAAFILAALPKIQDPVTFATSVDGFRVVSGELTGWVALLLPWVELIIGLGLLVPQLRLGSGFIIGVLLVAFMGLHVSAWLRGLDINCGCFGPETADTAPNYFWLIGRNFALLFATILVFRRDLRNMPPIRPTNEVAGAP
ncbi:MAG: DoxX family protein [Verrucomicrobia bacterium]|jgi:uncharacterized membrane protein YphA (DoxX/SURF4 family)|nr:DoxX family protein [Verrucomicrobiota bacterium]